MQPSCCLQLLFFCASHGLVATKPYMIPVSVSLFSIFWYCPIKVCKPIFLLSLYLENNNSIKNGTYTITNFGNYFELHKQ